MIYLDANATTEVSEHVRSSLLTGLGESWGNPSSNHEVGARARRAMAKARDDIVSLIPGALPEGIIFTSGGTEANNLIIKGILDASVVTTAVEHPSVIRPAEATGRALISPIDQNGIVLIDRLVELVPETGPVIVTFQWANSETGIVQPVQQIVSAIRKKRFDTFIHVDVAQAIGRVAISMDGLDAITFSGHKLHAPGGTGVLLLGDPNDRRVHSQILGGGQQNGWRSGTENVLGSIALGAALSERAKQFNQAVLQLAHLRDTFERVLLAAVPNARVNGKDSPRVPNTSNILFPGLEAMEIVALLDQMDVACSVGSACSSGKPEASYVLTAMGLSEVEAYSSVRFSVSVMNTEGELLEAADRVARVVRSRS